MPDDSLTRFPSRSALWNHDVLGYSNSTTWELVSRNFSSSDAQARTLHVVLSQLPDTCLRCCFNSAAAAALPPSFHKCVCCEGDEPEVVCVDCKHYSCMVVQLTSILNLRAFHHLSRSMEMLKLNTGAAMPALSLGFGAREDRIVDAIGSAIEIGYRGFDTAAMYYTEPLLAEAFGKAFKAGVVRREDIFVTSKLDPFEDPVTALKNSLSALQMDYVDLYLVHMPQHFKKDVLHKEIKSRDVEPTDAELFQIKIKTALKPRSGDTIAVNKELWQEMERCVELGLTKAIGVSNFSINKIEELLLHARIPPAVNQVEMHPLWQQAKLREYCKEKGILLSAYSPLGAVGSSPGTNDVMANPNINDMAVKYGKTPAQVILQWILGKGVSCIVRSYNRGRQLENFESLDWTLADIDRERIDDLPNQKRYMESSYFFDPVHGPYKTPRDFWGDEGIL